MTHGQVIQYSGDQTCRICAKESKNCGTIYDASCLVLILVVHVDLTVIYIYIKPFTKNKDLGKVLCLKNSKNHCVTVSIYSKSLKS